MTNYFAGAEHGSTLARPNVSSICLMLAGAIAVLIAVMWALRLFVYDAVPAAKYTALAALVFGPSAAIGLWRGAVPPWALLANFAACIVVVTVGIHFGGGVDNVSGPLLYALIIGLAGLIDSRRAAYGAAAVSTTIYGLLVWAERSGLLVHHLPYTKTGNDAAATVIAVGVYLLLVAWLVSYTASQLHAVHRRLAALRAEAVSALSHDLKNPLGAIRSAAELAAASDAKEIPEHLHRIQRGADTALELVHNVLDAAAVEQHLLQLRCETLDVAPLVAEVVELYRPAAMAKHIAIRTEASAPTPIRGDAQLLGRALGNLLSNAVKFTPDGGAIAIRVVEHNRAVSIEICDSGPGIAPAQRHQLFRKFSRLDSNPRRAGTGLGLYIVRALIEAHGGRVEVGDGTPSGAVFRIELPCQDETSQPQTQ